MKIKTIFSTGLVLLSLIGLGACQTSKTKVSADEPVVNASEIAASTKSDTISFFSKNGVAILGTDPVAYFTQNQAIKGSSEFSYDWQGSTWYFSSAENKDLFAANPDKYAPQYGGYCAWAVSQGATAPSAPDAWKIVGGKLYLNLSKDIQKRWEGDIPGNIAKADANWPGVLKN